MILSLNGLIILNGSLTLVNYYTMFIGRIKYNYFQTFEKNVELVESRLDFISSRQRIVYYGLDSFDIIKLLSHY